MDLKTSYMGLTLRNPLIASASPLSEDVANIKRLEDAGAAAVVMFSLFEEQIRHEEEAMTHLTSYGANSFGEALSYFPEVEDFQFGAEQYLDLIRLRDIQGCDASLSELAATRHEIALVKDASEALSRHAPGRATGEASAKGIREPGRGDVHKALSRVRARLERGGPSDPE